MSQENNITAFMACEKIDANLFRGDSIDFNTGQVFGGQVLGQAINAAQATVDADRHIHSAHAYFLLKGDVTAPIIYEIDRSRDGGSFSSRRVVAMQHGRPIFHLSASFQMPEEGFEFYEPYVLPEESLNAAKSETKPHPLNFQSQFFDVYYVNPKQATEPNALQMWVKAKHPLPNDDKVHCAVMAYISDYGLLYSSLVPHGLYQQSSVFGRDMVLASLDHAVWFHRPFKVDDWFFYSCKAQSTGNGRGFSRGQVYTKEGMLVASTSQEGVVRTKKTLS